MLTVSFNELPQGGTILCLGAHCDDVEIGCGGTLAELAQKYPDINIHVVIFCSDEERERESRRSFAKLFDEDTNLTLTFAHFRDGYLPYDAANVKEFLAATAAAGEADLIFTHSRSDLHQDHKFVGEITYQVFRDKQILEMEIPKYDGDLGQPNFFSPVSAGIAEQKVQALMNCYESQRAKYWFSEETFKALMRIRGLECRSESGLAEAFYVSKMVLS